MHTHTHIYYLHIDSITLQMMMSWVGKVNSNVFYLSSHTISYKDRSFPFWHKFTLRKENDRCL